MEIAKQVLLEGVVSWKDWLFGMKFPVALVAPPVAVNASIRKDMSIESPRLKIVFSISTGAGTKAAMIHRGGRLGEQAMHVDREIVCHSDADDDVFCVALR